MTDGLDDNLEDWSELQQSEWSGLLIGNGFSRNLWERFGYDSLFRLACQGNGAALGAADRSLFKQLKTTNFESVLSALATSKAVSEALDRPIDFIAERETSIRQALIEAVYSVHVPRAHVTERLLDHVSVELSNYASIYTTNYDLLLYWSLMRNPSVFADYFFGSGVFDVANTEVWGKKTSVHFLHGALHLYRRPDGQTLKRSAEDGQNLLDLFGTPYLDAASLFISEGSAEMKRASILRSDYLSFALGNLEQDTRPLVIFGHSLGESDLHLAKAIGACKDRHVAVSLLDNANVRKRKAALVKSLPQANLHFYDAATHPLGAACLRIKPPEERPKGSG